MSEAYAEPERHKPHRGGHGKTFYTQEIHEEIIARLSKGEPLEWICHDPRMPSSKTVNQWTYDYPTFGSDFAGARKDGFDAIASNTMRVARGEDGYSSGDVARDKLIVDTDLKLLAKWDYSRYGDRVRMDAKTETTVTLVDSSDLALLDADQREALKEIANALLSQRTAGKAISHWEDVDHEAIEGELSKKA